jgi:RND superfamily putative drug exporter
MFERWTRGVVHHRLIVVALWLIVIIVGTVTTTKLPGLLTTSLTVPGSTSATANAILADHFHDNIEGSFAVVVPGSHDEKAVPTEVRSALHVIRGAVVTEQRRVDSTWYINVDTPLSLARGANATSDFRRALRSAHVVGALVTGPPALQHDITPVLSSDLRRGEMVTGVVALLVLLAALGLTWAIGLPILVAGATTSLALLAMYLLAHRVTMVLYVPNVVELIGLGLAMDYSLLMVHRFRSEVADGQVTVEDAIVATAKTAGRTVAFSGLVFAVALAVLVAVPVPFVRSLALAAVLVPLAGIVGVLTLQPALLALWGRRGVRAHGFKGWVNRPDTRRSWWALSARLALRRPKSIIAVSLIFIAILASSLGWLELTPASLTAIPASMNSAKAIRLASAEVGAGFLTPIEIVIDTGRPGGVAKPALVAARLRMAESVLRRPGVELVAIGTKAPYVSASGRYERVFVVTRTQFGSSQDQTLVRTLRAVLIPAAAFPASSRVYVGGAASQGVDFLSDVYSNIGWLMTIVFFAIFLVLARAFRSLILPLIAVLLDLLSLAAAYGVLVAVFHFGIGSSWLGTYHVAQIEGWVPALIFAVLFGLSMDYEIFIVTRIREGVDRGLSSNDAIEEGLGRTGGVVSAAALIMVGAMSGFISGHVAGLQELGVGLGAGVIVDTTVVRALILPSVMGLFGRSNWWLPSIFVAKPRTENARERAIHVTPMQFTSASNVGSTHTHFAVHANPD